MKTTTTTTEEYLAYDLEALGLLSDTYIIESCRMGGKSLSSTINFLLSTVTTTEKKYLRTKVKKGCGKGRIRVTVVASKQEWFL